jgi:hypothetical protein
MLERSLSVPTIITKKVQSVAGKTSFIFRLVLISFTICSGFSVLKHACIKSTFGMKQTSEHIIYFVLCQIF